MRFFIRTAEGNDLRLRRSDEFSSVARVQRSFEFNNSTVRRCLEPSLDFLIFIISKSSHFSTRQTIRRTWAEKSVYAKVFPHLRVKFLFLLDLDLHSRRNIELENSLHADLVQVINLPEHYEYVTYREAAMYTFVRQRCAQTKYLLKTDDDIFLNLFLLFSSADRFLSNISSTLFGYPIDFGLVVRHGMDSVGERYVITHEEYACPRYPRFLSGFAYLLSFPLLTILLDAFEKDPRPFPLSDVYFTGLLAELFQLPRRSLFDHLQYLYQSSCHEQFFRSQSDKNQPFACAATTEHFHRSRNDGDSSHPTGMNSYHRLWMTLKELHS